MSAHHANYVCENTELNLWHTLTQDGTMTHDAKIRRAQYINKTTDIRNIFHFADPLEMLAAVDIDKYSGDHYGLML